MPDLESITREEMLLDGQDLEPITRKEMFIKRIYDKTQVVPEPITREEMFLKKAGDETTDVTIEQLNVSANGTYSESGKAYSPVIVNVALPENAYLLKDFENVPSDIATFSDGANLPMPNLKVSIEPQQDLHGYDYPWAGGAGKNKMPLTVDNIKDANGGANSWTNNSKEISGIVYTILTDSDENVIGIKANGTATANSVLYLMSTNTPPIQLDGQAVIISMAGFSKGAYRDNSWHDVPSTESAVTLNGDVTQIWGQIYNGVQVNNIVIQPMIRLASVADSTFAPYSNICPISGWSAVDVTVADDVETPTVSNVYTIDLDGTRYGGKLDVVSGVLTVDRAYVDLGTLNYSAYGGTSSYDRYISSSIDSVAKADGLCVSDIYTFKGTQTMSANQIWVGGGNSKLSITTDVGVYNDASAFKTAMNGVQLVYELATPQNIQLTPTAIKSLEGVNNVWADCGEILEGQYFSKEA